MVRAQAIANWRTAASGVSFSTLESLLRAVPRLKKHQQCVHKRLRLGRLVATKITHIHIQRHGGFFGPGVHAQVRLGQQHRGSDAARPIGTGGKAVHQLVDGLQPRSLHRLHAGGQQLVGFGEPVRLALAVAEISSEVQALHGVVWLRW